MNLKSLRAVSVALTLVAFAARAGQDISHQTARPTPQWLRDGVVYEVFPRNFSPAGNLNGITAKLDDLKDLGVTIVWLMPIHPIGEKARKGDFGSPYSIKDYFAIDPNYGTPDDLKRLVSEAHKRGMKVIMDVVANHTSWDSVMMNHPEFYKQDKTGKLLPPVPEWTDVAGLNYQNAQLRDYMIGMLKHWVQTCDVDGFRCDVAYMVPTDFWEQARTELEKTKPDIMLLAEASKPELLVKAFDIDYSWPLLATMNNVFLRGAPATDLKSTWEQSRREFPKGALHLRISDDHDEARAVARYSIRGAMAASALMFTLDGVPLLYNGMEAGDATESGDPALFDRMTIFWQPKERPPLRRIYRDLIQLRKDFPAFRSDNVTWLPNSDSDNVVTLLRRDETNEFVVVINFSNRPLNGNVNLPHSGEFKPLKFNGMPEVKDSLPAFRLNGFEWQVYHRVLDVAERGKAQEMASDAGVLSTSH